MELVNNDVSRLAKLNPSLLQTDAVGLRSTANGPDQVVNIAHDALVALVVLVCNSKLAIGVLLDLAGLGALVQLDSKSLVLLGDSLLDHRVEVTEECVVTDEEMGLGSESVEHASEFDGNVASANNGNLLWLCGNIEEAITVGAELGAGNLGWDSRLAADSNKNLLGVDEDLGVIVECDLGLVLGNEASPSMKVVDIIFLEVSLVDTV